VEIDAEEHATGPMLGFFARWKDVEAQNDSGVIAVGRVKASIDSSEAPRPRGAKNGRYRICLSLNRLPTEFRALCVRDATLREPSIRCGAGYTKWAIENHYVIA